MFLSMSKFQFFKMISCMAEKELSAFHCPCVYQCDLKIQYMYLITFCYDVNLI